MLHHPAAVTPVLPDSPSEVELELVLYVTPASQESKKAIRNLHRALKRYDERRYRLAIVDVSSDGDEEWYQALEEDRVIVTPTLVKRKPGPKTWIVGTPVAKILAYREGCPCQTVAYAVARSSLAMSRWVSTMAWSSGSSVDVGE